MKTIVLISCVSRKGKEKAKAKELYRGPLFLNSLKYAHAVKPDKIYILSAKHHLLDLDTEIEPYNVTLTYVQKKKRKPGLTVLNSEQKKIWGNQVVRMLSEVADIENDNFIIVAGLEYIKPIKANLKNLENVLEGVSLFDRPAILKQKIETLLTS